MSLSKQLLLLISVIFIIVFSVNFILSIGNIKSYLEVESEVHVQDTATSLGLSLSPYMVDEKDPIIRTMMNAIFDMGYYKEMRLVDVDGNDLIKLTNTEQLSGVPTWLIDVMPMKVSTAVSEISSGWSISGTLYVTTNPGYAYLKLYEQGKVKHVGSFPELEDELCTMGAHGGAHAGPRKSPDRADALVWAVTDLLLKPRRKPQIRMI